MSLPEADHPDGLAISKLVPEVKSTANPPAALLVAARDECQRRPEMRRVFQQAKEEDWSSDRLADSLFGFFCAPLGMNENLQQLWEVCLYLADEYKQLGEGILLVSRETGKTLARLTDEDFWQPPTVRHESGEIVQPPVRIRPDLEAFLVQWVFDQEREQKALDKAREKLPQTELVKAEGDRRLLAITHSGRTEVVSRMSGELPKFLQGAQGAPGQFLSFFEFLGEPPNDPRFTALPRRLAVAQSHQHIQDPLTVNARYDPQMAFQAAMVAGWIRSIGVELALAAKAVAKGFPPFPLSYSAWEDVPFRLWVGTREDLQPLWRAGANVLFIEGAPTIVFAADRVGAIVIHSEDYECRGRELFDRWEVGASFGYTLYVDWCKVHQIQFTDVPELELTFEVLPPSRRS